MDGNVIGQCFQLELAVYYQVLNLKCESHIISFLSKHQIIQFFGTVSVLKLLLFFGRIGREYLEGCTRDQSKARSFFVELPRKRSQQEVARERGRD